MKDIAKAYKAATRLSFDDSSKFVMMSDIHRGVGKKSDDFFKNKELYFHALTQYYNDDFTYIELGDGEELWENRSIGRIINTYIDIYMLLKKFYNKNRLHLLYGNHDMDKRREKYVKDNLYKYYDTKSKTHKDLFDGIKVHEALVLQHKDFEGDLFLIHGHQVDFINNRLWWLARFLLKVLWKPLEQIGIQDPTRPAKSQNKKLRVERRLTDCALCQNHMVIAGHTHKPIFSDIGIPAYFNDGSCVRKDSITAIEIERSAISLVKWSYKKDKGGKKQIVKEIVAGPAKIKIYFKPIVEGENTVF